MQPKGKLILCGLDFCFNNTRNKENQKKTQSSCIHAVHDYCNFPSILLFSGRIF